MVEATKGKPRPRSEEPKLPGMEDKKDPKLHNAAVRYAKLRDDRMQTLKLEVEAKQTLIDVMKEKRRKVYEYSNVRIELNQLDSIKVVVEEDEE